MAKRKGSSTLRPKPPRRRRRTRGCDARYETIPVMDAGNDILAVAGERDLTGKDVAFV